jgi:hypothetical protein
MSIYALGLRTTDTTINEAAVEIYTPATLAVRIMEIGITQSVATACCWGLGRPAAQGLTPVPVLFLPEQNTADPAAKTSASLSWGTSPTAPTQYLRRAFTMAVAGSGVVWTFPRGLILPPSASLVIFNVTATVASDVYIVIDE